MWFLRNVSTVGRRSLAVGLGLGVLSVLLGVGLLGCPFSEDDDDQEVVTASLTPPPAPGDDLKNFLGDRDESNDWCIWLVNQDTVHINVPRPGDYLFTFTTSQATLRIVARVMIEAVLIFGLQPGNRLAAATVQAGTIHAPGAVTPVHERDYAPPAIWPAPPYATLFAWPAQGGIGAWDQVFTPDPQARLLTLAETKNGRLDLWSCAEWFPPAPTPTATPEPPKVPTCGGTTVEGFCWYLSAVGATCQATCQARGLAVDTTIDAGGNFWDTHDAASCRNLLGLLQHPNLALSTLNLTMTSGYGLCGASTTGIVIKRDGGPQDATRAFTNGQVACPCR